MSCDARTSVPLAKRGGSRMQGEGDHLIICDIQRPATLLNMTENEGNPLCGAWGRAPRTAEAPRVSDTAQTVCGEVKGMKGLSRSGRRDGANSGIWNSLMRSIP